MVSRVLVKPSVIRGEFEAPPSKSYTHRVYAAALLSEGVSVMVNPLRSRDTDASRKACILLGAEIRDEESKTLISGGKLKAPENVIDVDNSGTTLRIFTAISALIPRGYVILTGDESIRMRPMKPLLYSLRDLGVECWSSRLDGRAPIIVRGGGVKGGETKITGEISSQFISALLYASVKSDHGTMIVVKGGLVSKPYIDASLEVLKRFGFRVENRGYQVFEVEGRQDGRPCIFKIPGDFSSASFFMAGAQLTGGYVKVRGVDLDLPQADSAIIEILREAGCGVKASRGIVEAQGVEGFEGGEYCLRDSPDLLPVVAVMAAKSEGETVIRGVEHVRFKESDRLSVIASELRKLGVMVEVLRDGLKIRGKRRLEGGCILKSHGDHRIFMALTVLAASTEKGCIIEGAESAEVSYPEFLDHARRLGMRVEVLED